MVRASAVAEQAGVPSVSLTCEGFLGQAATTARGLGLPNLPVASVPGHVDVQSAEELRRNVAAVTVDAVIRGLTVAPDESVDVVEPSPTDVVFEGPADEVNRFFYENGWSDGLPIVPPTEERVRQFLRFTDRAADETLGVLLPDRRRATIASIAVNGVMAGCAPQTMPVLVALVEAMADPRYGVEHSGNTPGAETLIILNGLLARELGFNDRQGALRDGFRANTAVGRFWRLYLRNVAGFHLHATDKGTFGNTWRVVLAENEEAVRRIGWTTLAQDQGLAAGANAVTISRFTGGGVVVSVFGHGPEQMIPYLADALTRYVAWEVIFTLGMASCTERPLLILTPILAETLAKGGLGKDGLKRMLWEQARIPAWKFERYIGGWTNFVPGRPRLVDLVREGRAPALYAESDDPQRLVPIVCHPEDIMVAVSGDPLRTNAYVFSHNGILGFPTTKPIRVPADWRRLLGDARAR